MSTLFRNASIIDGSGADPWRGDVLVEGDRIVAATPASAPAPHVFPPPADVVECNGATLMPGLVEPHAHLSFLDQKSPFDFHAVPVEEHLLATLRHAKLYLDQGFTACFSAAATKP